MIIPPISCSASAKTQKLISFMFEKIICNDIAPHKNWDHSSYWIWIVNIKRCLPWRGWLHGSTLIRAGGMYNGVHGLNGCDERGGQMCGSCHCHPLGRGSGARGLPVERDRDAWGGPPACGPDDLPSSPASFCNACVGASGAWEIERLAPPQSMATTASSSTTAASVGWKGRRRREGRAGLLRHGRGGPSCDAWRWRPRGPAGWGGDGVNPGEAATVWTGSTSPPWNERRAGRGGDRQRGVAAGVVLGDGGVPFDLE
jgi:hypothetical protein